MSRFKNSGQLLYRPLSLMTTTTLDLKGTQVPLPDPTGATRYAPESNQHGQMVQVAMQALVDSLGDPAFSAAFQGGGATAEALALALQQDGYQSTAPEWAVRNMVASHDFDGDGRLSRIEFANAVKDGSVVVGSDKMVSIDTSVVLNKVEYGFTYGPSGYIAHRVVHAGSQGGNTVDADQLIQGLNAAGYVLQAPRWQVQALIDQHGSQGRMTVWQLQEALARGDIVLTPNGQAHMAPPAAHPAAADPREGGLGRGVQVDEAAGVASYLRAPGERVTVTRAQNRALFDALSSHAYVSGQSGVIDWPQTTPQLAEGAQHVMLNGPTAQYQDAQGRWHWVDWYANPEVYQQVVAAAHEDQALAAGHGRTLLGFDDMPWLSLLRGREIGASSSFNAPLLSSQQAIGDLAANVALAEGWSPTVPGHGMQVTYHAGNFNMNPQANPVTAVLAGGTLYVHSDGPATLQQVNQAVSGAIANPQPLNPTNPVHQYEMAEFFANATGWPTDGDYLITMSENANYEMPLSAQLLGPNELIVYMHPEAPYMPDFWTQFQHVIEQALTPITDPGVMAELVAGIMANVPDVQIHTHVNAQPAPGPDGAQSAVPVTMTSLGNNQFLLTVHGAVYLYQLIDAVHAESERLSAEVDFLNAGAPP